MLITELNMNKTYWSETINVQNIDVRTTADNSRTPTAADTQLTEWQLSMIEEYEQEGRQCMIDYWTRDPLQGFISHVYLFIFLYLIFYFFIHVECINVYQYIFYLNDVYFLFVM